MIISRLALALLLGLLVAPTGAAQQPADGGFGELLFPPELVMQHQRALRLTAEQRTAVTRAVQELQSKAVELQWKLHNEHQALVELLREASADESAALRQIDRVLSIEGEIKRLHLAALIRIKNTLTADQQAQLRALQARGEPR